MEKYMSAPYGARIEAEGSSEPLWSIEDICFYMKRSKGYVYGLVNSKGFPNPVTHGERYRRWAPATVRAFISQPTPVMPVGRITSVIPINYEPQCSQPAC